MAGKVLGVLFPVFAGANGVLLNRWDALAAMAAIDRFKVTHVSFLVDGAAEIMDRDKRGEYDLTSLERTGGISFVRNSIRRFADAGAS
jgi:long-chain acyl-CoA synthetase